MSLCSAPEIKFLVTKLYDNILASGSKMVEVCNACITGTTLVKVWRHVNEGAAAWDKLRNKILVDEFMAVCLSSWWTL